MGNIRFCRQILNKIGMSGEIFAKTRKPHFQKTIFTSFSVITLRQTEGNEQKDGLL
jgi:hypothetical protein